MGLENDWRGEGMNVQAEPSWGGWSEIKQGWDGQDVCYM